MFERIKRLYETGKLTEAGVKNAIKKKWLSKEEAKKILTKA